MIQKFYILNKNIKNNSNKFFFLILVKSKYFYY